MTSRLKMHHPSTRAFQFVFQLVAAAAAGVLLGAALVLGSPLWAFVLLVGVGLAFLGARRPEFAMLGSLVCTSSVVFDDKLPLVPLGPVSLHVPDVILLALFALVVYRWIMEPGFRLVHTPLDWPVLAFTAIAVLSTAIAVLNGTVEMALARREMRYFAHFLLFFAVTNLVREKGQFLLLLRGLLLISVVVAVAMVAQYLVGDTRMLIAGDVYNAARAGMQQDTVTRIIPPGLSLLFTGFVVTAVHLSSTRPIASGLTVARWGLLGLALVLTFLRSYWIALGLAMLLALLTVELYGKLRLAGWGFALGLLALGVVLAASASGVTRIEQLAVAASTRIGTLGEQGVMQTASLKWRAVENQHAIAEFSQHPLLGLGMGARYRPYHPMLDQSEDWDARRFIHNGHLWILVKTGGLGYLCLVWLSLAFLIRGLSHWRSVASPEIRGSVLGFTLVYAGLLVAALVNSIVGSWSWTPVVGVMMGMNEVAIRNIRYA